MPKTGRIIRHLVPVKRKQTVNYDRVDVPYTPERKLAEGFTNSKQGRRSFNTSPIKTKGRVDKKGYLRYG